MTFRFSKMHGAGNDFVMIDDRKEVFPVDDPAFIARLANRPDGIGCEGVILVRPASHSNVRTLEHSNISFSMRFFNPDGSEADLCGNGARCVAAFARTIGAAPAATMTFETRAGLLSAEVLSDERVRLSLPAPKDLRKNFVNTGVPHAIVPVEDLTGVSVAEEGRRLRYSPAFAPAGTNVDFVKWTGSSSLSIRTYERGVEAETFACGTGSVAAALIGVAQYGLSFPVQVTTVRGDELEVDALWDGATFSSVTLTGPVKTVFSGEINA